MMDKALDVWVDGTCSFKGVECFMTPPPPILIIWTAQLTISE